MLFIPIRLLAQQDARLMLEIILTSQLFGLPFDFLSEVPTCPEIQVILHQFLFLLRRTHEIVEAKAPTFYLLGARPLSVIEVSRPLPQITVAEDAFCSCLTARRSACSRFQTKLVSSSSFSFILSASCVRENTSRGLNALAPYWITVNILSSFIESKPAHIKAN